jgi:pimeloyl-ACP methyl ester carboxylesterase
MMREHRVTGHGGIRLRVREWGSPEVPTVVLVHGYPDTSGVWGEVVEHLADRFHVVTYDVRGAGQSQPGPGLRGYRLDRLVADLGAVIEATAPGKQVHLVGHDWGAIQSWEAVFDDQRCGPRIASFTVLGTLCLDHAAHWIRGSLRAPRRLPAVLGQAVRSGWYMIPMHAPYVIPALFRAGLARAWPEVHRLLEGATSDAEWPAPTLVADAANGAWLYRANILPKLLRPGPGRTDTPVQVVVPTRDPFISPAMYVELAARVPNLWRRDLSSGHWAPRSRPETLARWIGEFAEHIETGTQNPELRQAQADATMVR